MTTLSFSRRAARLLRGCLRKDGPMPCASCNRTVRSGHSGITSAGAGRSTKACASTTSCSRRKFHICLPTVALIAGCEARTTRAITLRCGSCSICDLSVAIRLFRDQRELAQVVIIERTLSVGGLIQSECSGDFDFERTGFDKPVDLVQGWRVIFAVVALEFNASTFFGNGLDAVRIGGASTRS